VIDTRKSKGEGATPDDSLHVLAPDRDWRALLMPGAAVTARIDWPRRYRHMRFHTATHLLCAVVPNWSMAVRSPATYARLDFAMTAPLERAAVQAGLEQLIAAAHPVSYEWISDDELRANPQLVKSMSVSPTAGLRPGAACCACRMSICSPAAARTFATRARSARCGSRK